MPCSAPVRGKTDAKFPWADSIQNDPCGCPIITSVGGVDVSAQNLCGPHYAMKYGLAAIPAAAKADPATVLLLHGEALADEKGHPLTAVGDAKLDTAQSKFGGSSLLLDGTGDYLTTPDSPDWCFGLGDFTVECQARFNSVAASATFFAQHSPAPGNIGWNFTFISAGQLRFDYSMDGQTVANAVTRAWVPVVGQWYHVAAVRSGGSLMFFVDGAQLGASQNIGTNTFFDANEPLLIGGRASGANYMNGWLDELRISKGVARWTANFTPPSAPYA